MHRRSEPDCRHRRRPLEIDVWMLGRRRQEVSRCEEEDAGDEVRRRKMIHPGGRPIYFLSPSAGP